MIMAIWHIDSEALSHKGIDLTILITAATGMSYSEFYASSIMPKDSR